MDRSIRPRTFRDVAQARDYEEWLAEQDARKADAPGAQMTCRQFFEHDSHVDLSTPRLGVDDRAHDLELPRLELPEHGREALGEPVRLSDYADKQPAALVFGSYSCPPFRDSARALDDLYRRRGDRVAFFAVYIKEAHPEEGWVHPRNRRDGIALNDPTTLDQRAAAAARMVRDLALVTPVLVDTLAHEATRAYGAFPLRMYVIGRDGRVAYQSPAGPFGFDLRELEAALRTELGEA